MLTERQYIELCHYADGKPRRTIEGALPSLVRDGHLVRVHTDFYELTETGRQALEEFRVERGLEARAAS